jgi:AraC family transcriptional regulator of arabinose operon
MSRTAYLLSVVNIFNQHWSFRVGEVVYKDKSQLGPRTQVDLQLVYLYSGDLEITVDGVCYNLQPGEVTLLLPGKSERFHFAQQSTTYHGWCSAHLNRYDNGLLDRLAQRPERLPISEAMRQLVQQATHLREETLPSVMAYRDSLIQTIFCEFLSRSFIADAESSPLHPAVERARNYIELHFAESLNLEAIAQHAGITPTHLVRLFRANTGGTPMRYVWRFRLERSMQLLTETGLTVSEVSDRCGFSNPQHFSKLFKAECAATPGNYRATAWAHKP